MLTLKPATPTHEPFPWQDGHACHEDRAMGLELELIELVRRRDAAVEAQEPVEQVDREIDAVMAELAGEALAPMPS
ncbi:MAG TPA: hypothetical protein VNS19_03685 [Acidimicrobiales bacterium]|nr:hypothetical protein [Acidimicrobiales bacterium]